MHILTEFQIAIIILISEIDNKFVKPLLITINSGCAEFYKQKNTLIKLLKFPCTSINLYTIFGAKLALSVWEYFTQISFDARIHDKCFMTQRKVIVFVEYREFMYFDKTEDKMIEISNIV